MRALYLNADVASGPVLAHLMADAPPGREVLLGNYAWWDALWLQRALDALPASRVLLQATPYLLALLGAALVAYAVRAVTGDRWAAAISLVVLLAAGPVVWASRGAWTLHAPAWLYVAALGAFAVWLLERPRGRAATLAAVPLGALAGIGAASDPLVAIAGLVPLAVVALVTGPRRPLTTCLTAAAATWLVFPRWMDAIDVRDAGTFPIRAAPIATLDDNAERVARALADLVDGHFAGAALGVSTLLHAGAALLGALAAIAAAVYAARRLARNDTPKPLRAHLLFWSSGALALLAAVTLTTVVRDTTAARYLLGLLCSLAALLPLLGTDAHARGLIGAGVTAYALVGVMALARGEFTANGARAPSQATAHDLAELAAAEGVSVGYAGYWDAAPLTWATDFAVRIQPVRMCDDAGRPCAFEFHRISSSYAPRPGRRTMLVTDRTIRALSVTTVDPDLSRPAAVRHVGQLDVAIFDDDIAARFGPPARGPQALARPAPPR